MSIFKNILFGFLISFIGTIPLGYLNIIAFEIYTKKGIDDVILYILGIIICEVIFVFITILFIDKLLKNKRLIQSIEIFSIVFFLLLSILLFFQSHSTPTEAINLKIIFIQGFFITGFVLNALNFIQIPYWLGWTLYLINSDYIEVKSFKKYLYFIGIAIGTSLGILVFVFAFNYLFHQFQAFFNAIYTYILPLTLLILAVIQLIKYIKNRK